jgi:hypothetical protein
MVVLASLCNDVGYNGKTIKEPHTKEASTMDYTTFVDIMVVLASLCNDVGYNG